ncbi:Hypothetical predicted protein [Mytilus galloprovincialis]|uniref:Ig-like domain-containing protein n=1 Tax=Mytilus galloprovincialis TaxID=29158 RepID=A0A8B6D8I7_MYTGA|nr:Hypothetical predicted protein [Mytilus galloprovincialis]
MTERPSSWIIFLNMIYTHCTSLVIFFLISNIIQLCCGSSLEWNVKIEPVIFGEEAILSCKAQACRPNTRKKWIGGKKYDLLGFDNNSTNPSKYKMMTSGNSVNFDIMIMNFSVSDTNCEYTCACGFLQYTNKLKLENLNFIYPPEVNNDQSTHEDGIFHIDIVIQVFPLPTCRIFYQDGNEILNTTSLGKNNVGEIVLFKLRITDTINFRCKTLAVTNITCQIETQTFHIADYNIDSVKGNDIVFKTMHKLLIVGLSAVLLVLLLIGSVKVLRRKKNKHRRRKNKEKETMAGMPFLKTTIIDRNDK